MKKAALLLSSALIVPPEAQTGPISASERSAIISASVLAGHYEQITDRESAYEIIKARTSQKQDAPGQASAPAANSGSSLGGMLGNIFGGGNSRRQGVGEALVKSAVRTIGSEVGRQIIRGVLGSMLDGRR